MAAAPLNRALTIVARDPSVERDGQMLLAHVDVPYETLGPGPRGHRVHVVDVDTGSGLLYRPRPRTGDQDPYAAFLENTRKDRGPLLRDPRFHQQNVYAIVMRTLALFERALGRRVAWGFDRHQLRVVPHAFVDANAFYARDPEALMFGYFPVGKGHVFLCLSHDVVAHEATHAIVDGLRPWYLDPSSSDQAAFHEAFADLVAILSFFSLREIASRLLDPIGKGSRVAARHVTRKALERSILVAIGKEVAEATAGRDQVMRRSVEIQPARDLLERGEFQEPHRRGEVLVAAMLDAFLTIWSERVHEIADRRSGTVSRDRAMEDGAATAGHLLRSAIRALDYAPPVDLGFGDFLSALVTADRELHPDGEPLRKLLLARFAAYGVDPASAHGYWEPPPREARLESVHFESLQRDPQEVFRFLWENRGEDVLGLDETADTRVTWVRPCVRVASDGFVLRETVAEYVQSASMRADELPRGVRPADVPADLQMKLTGGGTLVFDEFGRLKYHVQNRLFSSRQAQRLSYLWEQTGVGDRESLRPALSFSDLHRRRLSGASRPYAAASRRRHARG
ncbi:MAG TPA: hypothetical protein VFL83_04635 [Anaeromyxobacter sp.]|nr:hypothetical protein [Anaeromyxobacter sp.]